MAFLGTAYDVPYGSCKLYYKDGVAMCVLGMGKINAALGAMAILSDARFDYREYGCVHARRYAGKPLG